MRRALSSILIAIFSLPLILQAISVNPAPTLPACCRKGGAHHCSMAGDSGSGPRAAQQRCPLFPQPGTIASNARYTGPAAVSFSSTVRSFGIASIARPVQTPSLVLPGSARKRGPPSSSN
jgi:hypothetical protein